MINITPIILGLITIIAGVVTYKLLPLLRVKFSREAFAKFTTTIDMLVAAAEQLYNSDQGNEKKMWVINYLAEHGFTFDMGMVDATIEAAVLRLHTAMMDKAFEVNIDLSDLFEDQDEAEVPDEQP
ncbi:hypothetical protein AGMMS49992_28910 [Clostridia bacterium]|nr:hypothetical protein AGMMS49992_28910 [Clostridia bacterium]